MLGGVWASWLLGLSPRLHRPHTPAAAEAVCACWLGVKGSAVGEGGKGDHGCWPVPRGLRDVGRSDPAGL